MEEEAQWRMNNTSAWLTDESLRALGRLPHLQMLRVEAVKNLTESGASALLAGATALRCLYLDHYVRS